MCIVFVRETETDKESGGVRAAGVPNPSTSQPPTFDVKCTDEAGIKPLALG